MLQVIAVLLAASASAADRIPLQGGMTTNVPASQGVIVLKVEDSALVAIEAIHADRRAFYAQVGRTLDDVETDFKHNPGASVFFGMTLEGDFIGLLKHTGIPYQRYQVHMLPLDKTKLGSPNEEGHIIRGVTLSRGQLGDEPGLCVRLLDESEREFKRFFVTGLDYIKDMPTPDFQSSCGAPATS